MSQHDVASKDADPVADEVDDPRTDQQGCGRVYQKLETCLGEQNRDWRACQQGKRGVRLLAPKPLTSCSSADTQRALCTEVQDLRSCYAKATAGKE